MWEMFDFGCDAATRRRKGPQQQGAWMTLDRKIRKDAFYLKGYWSDEDLYTCAAPLCPAHRKKPR
jgi:hypothetical protein